MKYDKINFLYRAPTSIYSSYIYFDGMRTALERNGLLHYAYAAGGKESLNMAEILKCPILCVNGSWEPVFSIVKSIAGRQLVVDLNSELPFRGSCHQGLKERFPPKLFRLRKYLNILKSSPRQRYKEFLEEIKMLFKINIFKDYFYPYKLLEERSKYFDLYFSGAEEDLNKYFGKSCYFFMSWAHTELLDDIVRPFSDKILFVGAPYSARTDFLKEDKNKIVEVRNTAFKKDPAENVRELGRLINEYKYTLCPMGIVDKYIPGKIFEYMACKRLCFCYSQDGRAIRVKQLFEDGKEIVYFKTFRELEEKYQYYLRNPKEADRIAQAGYEKVRKYHNADVRARRFAEIVLHHANGGRYEESYNDISLFGVKSV